jgi:hypothetical protein
MEIVCEILKFILLDAEVFDPLLDVLEKPFIYYFSEDRNRKNFVRERTLVLRKSFFIKNEQITDFTLSNYKAILALAYIYLRIYK